MVLLAYMDQHEKYITKNKKMIDPDLHPWVPDPGPVAWSHRHRVEGGHRHRCLPTRGGGGAVIASDVIEEAALGHRRRAVSDVVEGGCCVEDGGGRDRGRLTAVAETDPPPWRKGLRRLRGGGGPATITEVDPPLVVVEPSPHRTSLRKWR
jgi:hypothetical protein